MASILSKMAFTSSSDFMVRRAFASSVIEQRIIEAMLSKPETAKKIGMPISTFYSKKKKPDEFSLGELDRLAGALKLTDDLLFVLVDRILCV